MIQTGARTWRGDSLDVDGLHGVLGMDGQLDAWSPELTAATGHDEATLRSMDPLSLFEGDDRDRIRTAIGRCLGTGEAEVTATLSGSGTRSRRLDFRFVRVTDDTGRAAAVCVTARADTAVPWSTVRAQSDRLVELVQSDAHSTAARATSD